VLEETEEGFTPLSHGALPSLSASNPLATSFTPLSHGALLLFKTFIFVVEDSGTHSLTSITFYGIKPLKDCGIHTRRSQWLREIDA
jgi:hypothetical protein